MRFIAVLLLSALLGFVTFAEDFTFRGQKSKLQAITLIAYVGRTLQAGKVQSFLTTRNAKGKEAVKLANRQDNPLLVLNRPLTFECNGDTLRMECIKGQSLSGELREWVGSLLDRNMKDMSNATPWGWNLEEKMKEITAKVAYLIIVRTSSGKPVALSHFRFNMECDAEVVHCWELQVEESMRGCGIGTYLLDTVTDLATYFNMRKTMLTVFTKNKRAYDLYIKRGFSIDEPRPEEDFYEFLSKPNDSFKE